MRVLEIREYCSFLMSATVVLNTELGGIEKGERVYVF